MSLDAVPLSAFFFGTIAIILIAVEAGFFVASRAVRRATKEKESPAAAIGGAVLGLVAFMLAFTFGIAAARFDSRKELVRHDAEAIRTAWLRADFLPDPERAEIKSLLREYLEDRVTAAETKDYGAVRKAVADASGIQRQLWALAVANGKKDLNSDIGALLVEAINDVINTHALRVTVAVDTRIPFGIWLVLFTLTGLGMAGMGYHMAISGSKWSWTSGLLAVAFALVIMLIAGLDRPNTPFVSVTQKPMHDLRTFMDQAPPLPAETH